MVSSFEVPWPSAPDAAVLSSVMSDTPQIENSAERDDETDDQEEDTGIQGPVAKTCGGCDKQQ